MTDFASIRRQQLGAILGDWQVSLSERFERAPPSSSARSDSRSSGVEARRQVPDLPGERRSERAGDRPHSTRAFCIG